tara:strand:- start:179 stop:589 length:411 start_codon:yes stop_codon:yes gene_type:complete
MKKFLLVLALCLFSFSANAKVTVSGTPLKDKHINVIKGHLYDYAQNVKNSDYTLTAKTINWIATLHEDEKTHELVVKKNKGNKMVAMILSGIQFYTEIEQGVHEPKLTKANIYIWHELGKRVVSTREKSGWKIKLN